MAEPSRFNQMRLPDISCREDESDPRADANHLRLEAANSVAGNRSLYGW
jgi:hypothetical protein